jgi:hypothetical protein
MIDPRSFIARWSRRKRAAASPSPVVAGQSDMQAGNTREANAAIPLQSKSDLSDFDHCSSDELGRTRVRAGEVGERSEPGGGRFDVTKLPAIESITAETDIRAFLAPGVPPELARAALRRAWAADPKIREFVGLSENAWDFTAPDGVAGFGPLEMTDELRRQIVAMVGRNLAEAAPDKRNPSAIEAPGTGATPAAADQSLDRISGTVQAPFDSNMPARTDPVAQRKVDDRARQHDAAEPDSTQPVAKRRHGRALPE